ncbi:hypothetical protein ACFJIS_31250 [Variovorax boronicumulans]|uniref:hypothetical protein n=1 Tax=Variovorax boronicumulans TaxID=436515 RepID=UPI0036F20C75
MNFRDWNEQQDLTQFLHHEARLLDEHRWDEWQKLFTPERPVLGAAGARPGRPPQPRLAVLRGRPAALDARAAA